MKPEYDPGNFELPCDTMFVEEKNESHVRSQAWLYFSPRLRNKDRKIIVRGSLFVEGTLGATDNMDENRIGEPTLSWSGVRIEPCGEADFGSATFVNSITPLEIRSRYVRLSEVTFRNAAFFLLPDSSIRSLALVQSDQSGAYIPTATEFVSGNLAYFQGSKGRCKDLEKRIEARAASSRSEASTAKEDSDSFWISMFYWEVISAASVLIMGAFVYLR